MKKKRVLILYATYGSGHKSVAMSIYNYFLDKKKYDVRVMDIMDYENFVGYLSKKAFEQNFKHKSSLLFSMIYEIFDRKSTTIPYKHIVKSLFKNKKLREQICEFDPDLVICSHFFGGTIVAGYNKKGLIDSKLITILTDYVSHELWIKDVKYTDAFVVSSDIMKNELIEKGIDKRKVFPFGIPINMQYGNDYDIDGIKRKYKVNNDKKTILMFAGPRPSIPTRKPGWRWHGRRCKRRRREHGVLSSFIRLSRTHEGHGRRKLRNAKYRNLPIRQPDLYSARGRLALPLRALQCGCGR